MNLCKSPANFLWYVHIIYYIYVLCSHDNNCEWFYWISTWFVSIKTLKIYSDVTSSFHLFCLIKFNNTIVNYISSIWNIWGYYFFHGFVLKSYAVCHRGPWPLPWGFSPASCPLYKWCECDNSKSQDGLLSNLAHTLGVLMLQLDQLSKVMSQT